MIKYKVLASLCLVPMLLLFNISNGLSQNCPPDFYDGTVTNNITTSCEVLNQTIGSINYNVSIMDEGASNYPLAPTPAVISIVINSTNKGTIWLTDEATQELLEKEAASACIPNDGWGNGLPWSGYINIYFTSECTAQLKTVYKVKDSQTGVCCDDPNADMGQYTYNNETYYNSYQTASCGSTQCCMHTYRGTCKLEYVIDHYVMLKSVYRVYPTEIVTPCNSATTYTDCLTGAPIPCSSSCGE